MIVYLWVVNMNNENSLEKLREMAIQLLESQPSSVELNIWGNNVKDLLQELNIYHIELEHQNNELERVERELAVSRDEYVELFENAPIGCVIIDREGKICKLNRTFIDRFVPLHKKDVCYEGISFSEFICPEFQNSFYLYCHMLNKPGVPLPLELKLYDRFNNPCYVMITAGARSKDPQYYRLAISDISMQKKLETQLVMARDKAEENDRKKSLFLTNVSHAMRTPLTTIIGFIELLDNQHLNYNTMNEYFDAIKLAGKMLMSLTNEIMELSTLENGTVPLQFSNTNVKKICDELVTLVQREIKAKNVLIRNEMEKIPVLWTDQIRLQQMIFAILKHAAENAMEGTVVIRGQYVSNDKVAGFLRLEFSGRNIFSGESNLDMSIQRKPVALNCAGLDFFLARQIIKMLNGKMIWIHPLDSLRVEIPIKISYSTAPFNNEERKKTDVQFSPRTCLLVDDVVMNLKVLSAIIKLMNCVPTLANSAQEALELIKKNHYDFIMTDLWMPEMNGEELASMVRQDHEYDDIPIFAVTADVEYNNNFDMDFFEKTIIKPVNIDKIKKLFVTMEAESQVKGLKESE